MGNCTITIKLVGQHHNATDIDCEQMTARFVENLKEAGHHVSHAGVTHGGEVDVLEGSKSSGLMPVKTFTGKAT